MPFVLDCCVTMAWCFDDEDNPYAGRVLELLRSDSALVPAFWSLEVANTMVIGQRRGRLSAAESTRFLSLLRSLPIESETTDSDYVLTTIRELAVRTGLAAYDAAYLDLALRSGLQLATDDARLRVAALAEGVTIAVHEEEIGTRP